MMRSWSDRLPIVAILFLLGACKSDVPPQTTTVQSATPTVTKLEPPQAIATTTLEVTSPTKTTTVTVQQALSDLQAQKTNEGIRITLPEDILFDFDKYNIRPSAKSALQKLSVVLKNYQNAPVQINGHTDSKGDDAYNQTLSENRAKSVKDYLTQNFGIDGSRLEPKGFGEIQPVAPNTNPNGSDNPTGRQKNRRVEVIIRTPT